MGVDAKSETLLFFMGIPAASFVLAICLILLTKYLGRRQLPWTSLSEYLEDQRDK